MLDASVSSEAIAYNDDGAGSGYFGATTDEHAKRLGDQQVADAPDGFISGGDAASFILSEAVSTNSGING